MPFSLILQPPVVFASWRGFTLGDLREITDHISEMKRTTRHPVVYLSRIPTDHHVFTEDEQKVLLGFLIAILPSCATIHHVLEGDGFVKSARLGTLSHMAAATPRPRHFYAHATMEEARRSLKTLHGVELGPDLEEDAHSPPPERASGAFREAARLVEGLKRSVSTSPSEPRKAR